MASSYKDLYITGLRNAHALENQAIELLKRQVERLENYPAMSERMRQHIEESRNQAKRIEQILNQFGTSESSLKDAGLGLMGNLLALAHAPAPDEVVKNTFANYAFENYEIASYRGLLTMAEAAGDTSGPALLQQSLDEETRMAEWINQHLPETIQTYIQRNISGQTAGR
ncbi:MAG: ferritin-like domain-containing protein [Acetobacteraceae bacterium]|nr:ferritin-like domain-containing protein [Acetobacteraceae bacterium]